MLPALDIPFYPNLIRFNGNAKDDLHMPHGRELNFTALGSNTQTGSLARRSMRNKTSSTARAELVRESCAIFHPRWEELRLALPDSFIRSADSTCSKSGTCSYFVRRPELEVERTKRSHVKSWAQLDTSHTHCKTIGEPILEVTFFVRLPKMKTRKRRS